MFWSLGAKPTVISTEADGISTPHLWLLTSYPSHQVEKTRRIFATLIVAYLAYQLIDFGCAQRGQSINKSL